MTSLVVNKVINGRVHKLRLVWVGSKVISEGVVKLERVQVICPACGEQVEAVASDGQVKGYCAVAKKYVDFPIETQRVPTDKNLTAEARAKQSASTKKLWQDPEYRAKQTATHTGKHPTAETKAKISAVHMGKHRQHAAETRVKISSALMGKHLTAETKAKISAAKKGKPLTSETKAKISATLKRRHNKKGMSHV